MTLVRKPLFRVEAEVERELLFAQRLLSVLRWPARVNLLVPLHGAFVDVEINVDRVDRHDRREHRIAPAGIDEVALR